jgi:hypothetical protein
MQNINFLNKCKGIALVSFSFAAILFGSAAMIYSINPAKADQPTVANVAGKILMDQNSFVHDGGYYYHILVWDSETGKSKIYNMSNGTLVKTEYQLEPSPLY